MTWAAQAAHVARKDIRFSKWPLVVYSVLVALTLASALQLPVVDVTSRIPLVALMCAIVVFGLILAASALQSDSPTHSAAFWASRPFAPTAMLGAKMLYCAIAVIGIPVVAQIIGLRIYAVPIGQAIDIIAQSASIYALFLLSALVVAGLTSDLRGFVVGALAITLGLALVIVAIATRPDSMFGVTFSAWFAVVGAIAVSVGMLIWLYRRRDVTRVAWIGAIVSVGLVIAAAASIDSLHSATTPTALRPAQIGIRSIEASPADHPTALYVSLTATGLPAGIRLEVATDSVLVTFRDGSVARGYAPLSSYTWLYLDDADEMLPDGIRRYGPADGRPAGRASSQLHVGFLPKDQAKLALGVASISISARMTASQRIEIAQTPLGRSLSTTAAGTRIQVTDNFGPRGKRNSVSVRAAILNSDNASPRLGNPISAALINDRLGEGVVLSSSSYSSSNDYLVLPGAPIDTRTIEFNTERRTGGREILRTSAASGSVLLSERSDANDPTRGAPRPDAAWYDGAKIVVYRWIGRGSYPVRITKQF